jgi:hypothetical protein
MSKNNPYHYPGDGRHGDDTDTFRMTPEVRLRRLLLANKREADKREPDRTNLPRVYVIQRHRSQSGMTRHLALYVNVDGAMHDVTRYAATVLGWKLNADRDGIKVEGAGMDMHFHTVYVLGRKLYPKGNTSPNVSTYQSRDAGYMLKHETL